MNRAKSRNIILHNGVAIWIVVVIGMASLGIFVYSDWLWQANKLVHRYTSEEIAKAGLLRLIIIGLWVAFISGTCSMLFMNNRKLNLLEEALIKANEKIRILSLTDEFTGIYNRRGFFTLAEQHLKIINRMAKGMGLFFVDIDGLKLINDTLGHQEGDMAIIDTVNILKNTFRESDIIARMGGDEFAISAIGTYESDIKILATRLQENVKSHNGKNARSYNLSISVGVMWCDHKNPRSVEELLLQADKLMYQQKQKKNEGILWEKIIP